MSELTVYKKDGKEAGKQEVSSQIFFGKINERLLELVVRMYANNKRTGNANTKTRREVRGGGAKPWKQKGTGRARVSSSRNPLWRGGGIVFGPRKRDICFSIPKKMRTQALISALSKKVSENKVIVVDEFTLSSHKTKEAALIFERLKTGRKKTLLVLDSPDEIVGRAVRNIEKVSLRNVSDVNAYQILKKNILVIDVKTIQALEKRILAKDSKRAA